MSPQILETWSTMSLKKLFPALLLSSALAACGGGAAAPASSSAAPPASKPAAAGSAAAKPATSGASAKPAASGAASTKPAASGSAAAGGKLVTSYSEIYEGQTPVWVTQDAGIFKQNGLDVEQNYIASSNVIAALVSGQVAVAQGGGSEALSAAAGGADLVVIGNIVPVYPYVLEVAKDIKSVDDLKGKKIGVSSFGSASDIATRVALKKVGLDPDKDVSIIPVGSSQNRSAALASGAIQAGMDQPPSSYDLEKQGLHALFDMASLKLPTVNNGIVVQRAWLNSHKDVAQKYVDSIVQGIARTKKDQTFAADTLAKYMKLDDKAAAAKAVAYADQNLFPSSPDIKPDGFTDSVAVLSAKNPNVKNFDVNKIIDDSLVQSAVQKGLDK
jgi:ABC-type nitrate/sulfonate/bicarbonate transport system substrate-binding protein